MMTPVAHTSILPSIFRSLLLIKHSGAIQVKLPISRSYQVNDLMTPAIPKSIILIRCSSLLTKSIFSSFRSLWISPLAWQQFIALAICLIKFLVSSSLSRYYFLTNSSSYPPSRYSIIIATFIFLRVKQLCTFTILSCFKAFKVSASTKILSISAAEPILSVLIIFIATSSPVCLCIASSTSPNPPSPNFFIISYSPKQPAGSNSSPFEAYNVVFVLTKHKSSSKYSAPSVLKRRR